MSQIYTDAQIDRWRLMLDEANDNKAWIAKHEKRDAQRLLVQQELLELFEDFQSKKVMVEELKNIFDRRTRTDWDVFGLKGTSGAMFLNKMVKHIPNSYELTEQLNLALSVPQNETEGHSQMQQFYDFLQRLIDEGIRKALISPGYTPFFLSAWWHFQNTEQWPIFYVSGRKAFEQEGHYTEISNPVENYFAFRKCFLELASALHLQSWELEHLLSWYVEERSVLSETIPPISKTEFVSGELDSNETETKDSTFNHTQIQWTLAKIGRKLGCRVWIAANDHNKTWKEERLGDMSINTLPSLGMDPVSRRIISMIDVLWIKGFNQVVAAFEIEHTTSIYSGLLRMSDLSAVSPNVNFPLYIVTPEERMDKVKRELSRPTFQMLELHKLCGFFSFESLIAETENIMKWASDPVAIDRLATKVDDVSYEDGI